MFNFYPYPLEVGLKIDSELTGVASGSLNLAVIKAGVTVSGRLYKVYIVAKLATNAVNPVDYYFYIYIYIN